jgi:hypothetical protein
MRKILSILFLFLLSNLAFSQSYSYSYTDPCTRALKSIDIPYGKNEVTVNYYGTVRTFVPGDFYNGTFSSWINSVSVANPNGPCDQVRIVLTRNLNMVVAQNVITTIMNVTSITSALSMSDQLGNAVSNSENESDKKENDKKSDAKTSTSQTSSQNSDQTANSSVPQTPVTPAPANPGGSTTNTGGSAPTQTTTPGSQNSSNTNNSQTQSNQKTGSTNGAQSGNKSETKKEQPVQQDPNNKKSSESNSSTNATSNSISNAEENSGSKPGSKSKTGSMIGTGDIVMLKSAEDNGSRNQYRMTGSFTRANTNNTRVWGVLGNFTTGVNLTNLTIYRAWVISKTQWTIIGANSSMLNFDGDAFNTTTLVSSKRFKGNWKKLTAMGGLNFTFGKVGESGFDNISAVGGGFYSYKLGKKVSGSILCLAVYSPFTHFYEGKWWESGTLIVPFNSWDYKITKTFKFNVSVSGVYEMKQSVLNYQVLMGGKILL